MNVLFLLTPKANLTYIYEDYTIRQALERTHGRHAVVDEGRRVLDALEVGRDAVDERLVVLRPGADGELRVRHQRGGQGRQHGDLFHRFSS